MTRTTNSPSPTARGFKILAGRIISAEPTSGLLRKPFLTNQTIEISRASGRILSVTPTTQSDIQDLDSLGASTGCIIDLRDKTVLPGFIDAHVHFFLHPYTETTWEDQVTRESTVERTIRAVTHSKKTLLAGYTTVRDLGTEGAEDADISLRKCISRPSDSISIGSGIIPGPRYHCASRAIVATGSYGPKNNSRPYATEVDGKQGADSVSGVDECMRAVRRHIGAGADWIKIYADYPARALSASTNAHARSFPLFTPTELRALISTAHSLNVPVAAHCVNASTIQTLLDAGIDTLEHGTEMTEQLLEKLKEKNVGWCPTFAAYYSHRYPGSRRWDALKVVVRKAVEMGVRVATGGDTGVFSHGENALEMQLMHRLGIPWEDIIVAATWTAWLCVRGLYWGSEEGKAELEAYAREGGWEDKVLLDNDVAVGYVAPGFAADIIATDGDLEGDYERAVEARSICFVMKDGVVYKRDGVSCC